MTSLNGIELSMVTAAPSEDIVETHATRRKGMLVVPTQPPPTPPMLDAGVAMPFGYAENKGQYECQVFKNEKRYVGFGSLGFGLWTLGLWALGVG